MFKRYAHSKKRKYSRGTKHFNFNHIFTLFYHQNYFFYIKNCYNNIKNKYKV